MPVHKTAGARKIFVAIGCRRCGDDLDGTDELSSVRNRLAPSPRKLASDECRMRVLGLKELANMIHSLYAIEACRPPFGSCRRPRDDHGGAGCTGEGRSRATAVCSERDEARAEAANAQADLSSQEALIAHLKLAIEKLRRAIYGSRSERQVRLLDQLELQLEELEAAATEDQLAAEAAAAQTQTVRSFQRKRPVRKPFPADIERERVVIEAPTSCACCGGSRLSYLGEATTETLEEIPRRFKVIETVREKFTCRDCEAIT